MTSQEGWRYDPLAMLKWVSAVVYAALDEVLSEGLSHDSLKPSDVPSLSVDDMPHLKKAVNQNEIFILGRRGGGNSPSKLEGNMPHVFHHLSLEGSSPSR